VTRTREPADGISLQDAVARVRAHHQRNNLPVAESPQLLPTDGLKAMQLSVRLIELGIEIGNLPAIQKCLIPSTAEGDVVVRFVLQELGLLADWLKAHVQGDLEGAAFAWGDRLYLLLRETVAVGLPVEQLFTLTHTVIGSASPTDSEGGQGQTRPAP
jgi:hypothetical protein